MIFGIVVLHTPPYVPIVDLGSGAFDQFKALFQNAAFRAAVPMLTMLSGYLLFRTGLDQHWGRLALKKFQRIVIPFLVFNLVLLALAYGVQRWAAWDFRYQLHPFDQRVWLDAAFGLTQPPVNYPLNFLRDLIAVMLLAPLMGYLLRKAAWPGLALVVTIFYWDLDGLFVLRNVMPIMVYIGGMAAVRRWNVHALDGYAWPCLAVFMLVCLAHVQFRIETSIYFGVIAPFLIWPASALATGRGGRWLQAQNRYSYFIFLAHAPLLAVGALAYQRFDGVIPYAMYWAVMPFACVGLLILVFLGASAIFPRSFPVVIGELHSQAD